jgi:hypothetical protein
MALHGERIVSSWHPLDTAPWPRRGGAVQEVAYVPAPTDAADQSSLCGAVSRPALQRLASWDGRVEHVVSGQVTHFHSLADLLAFIRRVLTDAQTP